MFDPPGTQVKSELDQKFFLGSDVLFIMLLSWFVIFTLIIYFSSWENEDRSWQVGLLPISPVQKSVQPQVIRPPRYTGLFPQIWSGMVLQMQKTILRNISDVIFDPVNIFWVIDNLPLENSVFRVFASFPISQISPYVFYRINSVYIRDTEFLATDFWASDF